MVPPTVDNIRMEARSPLFDPAHHRVGVWSGRMDDQFGIEGVVDVQGRKGVFAEPDDGQASGE